jgi:hypothetical protein
MTAKDAKPVYKEPVFIVGMPRSGTTLLQGILCNTGKYFAVPETHFFSRVVYGLPEELQEKDLNKILGALAGKSRIEIDKNFILKRNTQKEIFEYVVGFFNTDNKNTFLEKTPRHVFFYSKIVKYYPGAKFICMIREPKNVVSSQMTSTRMENKSVIRLAFLYNKIAAAILMIKNNRNVFVIKYEDLTKNSEAILIKTFEFLDIAYRSEFSQKVAAPPEIIAAHEFWKNKNIEQETIQKSDADKWRKALSPGQADMVNWITRSYAEQFGYAFRYNPIRAVGSFLRDIPKLTAKRELKRLFSKIHG